MILHKHKLPLSEPPRSLCVLRLSAIGDVCNTVPLVRTLQRAWPQTKLTWIIGRVEAALVGDLPGVEFIIFDKKAGRAAFHAVREELGGRRFDVLLHMQAALRASLLSRVIDADVRLGFDRERAKDMQTLFTNCRITPQKEPHVLDGFFAFAEALGIEGRDYRWDIPIPEAAAARAAEWLPDERKHLVISPCSSVRRLNFRNWRPERYAAVADYAAERYGLHTVITGGPTDLEREYSRFIREKMQHPATDLVGVTSLKELLAVLGRATAAIAPDSGPAHMATAVGTPVIGLYATNNPGRTGPYFSRQWTVDKYPEAVREAFGKEASELAWGRRVRGESAMDLIEVEDVVERLDALMSHLAASES